MKLKLKLRNNEFPENTIEETVDNTVKNFDQKEGKKGKEEFKYLALPYPGKKKASKLRKLSKGFKNLKIAFKKRKNLGSLLSRSFKYNNKVKKGIIYDVKCKCGEHYIGETGKTAEYRLSRHKYAVKNGDISNGPANHGLICSFQMDWESMVTLEQESRWNKRKIIEGLWIQRMNPKLNLNKGWCPKGDWN